MIETGFGLGLLPCGDQSLGRGVCVCDRISFCLSFPSSFGGRAVMVPSPTSQPPLDQVGTSRSLVSGRLARITKGILGVSEHMGTGGKSPGMLVPVHLSVAEVKGQNQQVAATSECFVGG